MQNNKRIQVDKSASEIRINAFYDSQKQVLLTFWLVLWSFAGIAILSQFIYPMQDGLMIYLIVYLAFWAYFEYKILYAFRWRKYGKEIISSDGEFLSIENRIAGRGLAQRFEQSWIKNLRIADRDEQSFWQIMNQSYWNIGQEGLVFESKGRDFYFGRDLSPEECREVLKFIKNRLSS